MEALIQAAIELHDATLRYAEVERSGAAFRLLKLGSCEFDFDVMQELSDGSNGVYIDTLGEALQDVFSQTEASDLHVVLHPPHGYSFFAPINVEVPEAERQLRFEEEASILTHTDTAFPLHLTADRVFTESLATGKTVDWFHVLGIEESIQSRFDHILRPLPHRDYRFGLSTRAAARIVEVRRAEAMTPDVETGVYSLAVGFYDTHIEYALCRQQRWYFSHFASAGEPADAVYYALALLKRLHIPRESVRALHTYGSRPASPSATSWFAEVFGTPCEPLNPIEVVELDGRRPGDGFVAESYAPCIGAAL